ncbi:MAG TPA: hypothetical protein VGM05_05165 [Planctomycetaceae bacterium]|jgi:hypothetical protein
MSESTALDRTDDDDGLIYMNGSALDLESLESAIDALARDEAVQADERYRDTHEAALDSQDCETE